MKREEFMMEMSDIAYGFTLALNMFVKNADDISDKDLSDMITKHSKEITNEVDSDYIDTLENLSIFFKHLEESISQ